MERRQASKFYPHFKQEERPVIDYFTGLFNQLIFKHGPLLTDFLDPGKRTILKTVVGNDVFIQEYGGYPEAEKKRVYLSEEWFNLQPADYQIQPYEIKYSQKFNRISHSAILGTLANSGIDTDTFGDIITDSKGNWQFFAKKELTDFFEEQIDRVGRSQVKLKPISFKQVLVPEDDSVKQIEIIASMRIDAVLAGISRKSRGQIQKMIEANLVKLNWHDVMDSNIMVKENDVLSLRHFGRIKIEDISATRKGKYKVVLKLWQTKKRN
ncbi:RNA-binding protein [Lactobacillus kefiranofaciens]|uniref:YlmH family RNA-binding protein n=1 Tax=Lactobacillus kefiranofaciens TaxID=267818 RepID=UPI0006EF9C30|nr:YlmH/Sll1252 family protein [Lactobacillus kefiranofaciens]KRL24335.1 cell-division protein [Lactobacillus kefiranofaciens subsp. kefirgranum DSM 10550 = JCM 8572]MCJ2171937.1 YlmH/Sll1252 family protein [Lactobacillus kefiranofaciens]PAK98610.1 RNA-binding protein [Lactobacillus kefiranofaciens]QNT43500.1 RNA-binding protein [Lactobacillus kefiranofaciens]